MQSKQSGRALIGELERGPHYEVPHGLRNENFVRAGQPGGPLGRGYGVTVPVGPNYDAFA